MAVFEGTFTTTEPLRFAMVIGRFNDLVTTKLVEACQDCLKRHGIDIDPQGSQVDYVWMFCSFIIIFVRTLLVLRPFLLHHL